MFSIRQVPKVVALAAWATLSMFAGHASAAVVDSNLGAAADGQPYDRTVRVRLNTKVVSVDDGQVVRFVVEEPAGADTSFTWRFRLATAREGVGDLSKLAPAGSLARSVKVYVGPDSRYSTP